MAISSHQLWIMRDCAAERDLALPAGQDAECACDQAEDDLADLVTYLYPRNPSATLKYVADVCSSIDRLDDFPLSGRVYDDLYQANEICHR